MRSEVRELVMNETEVYAAPITEVSAAAHRISPNTRRPASPAAAWKALPAGSSVASVAPPATTPRIARNRMIRIRPVSSTPVTELRVMSRTCSVPVVPVSSRRCAPAYVM